MLAASDALAPEAGIPEAGIPEAGIPEAGIREAGTPGVGILKAGAPEAELPALEAAAPEAELPALEAAAPEAELPAPEAELPAPEAATPEAAAPAIKAPVSPAPEPPASATSVSPEPALATPEPAPVAARFVNMERERPLLSIERALSGPGSRGEVSWRRQVKVVAGGQGPGKRDPETLDRNRARLPLAGPRRIAVLGCTRGAGQTVTALVTGHILAAVRGVAVAALDLNPGATSLAARRAPAASVQALLAGREPTLRPGRGAGARLEVIAELPETGRALGGKDFQRLADLLAERYPLTLVDPAPSGLTRVLSAVDQLVLVAPASPDAATSLANTQQWLSAHGYGELVGRAVTVVNGVSRRTREDALRAESVARGRCRAIVRVPWDDLLSARPGTSSTSYVQMALNPQTRLAYTALAGVLVAGMAEDPGSPVPGRNLGDHSD